MVLSKSSLLLLGVLSLTPMAFGAAISVNGTCELGNCASPDVLAPGGSDSGTFNFTYTLANSDQFSLSGNFGTSLSSGFNSITGMNVSVVYLGNVHNATAPSGADTLVSHELQGSQYPFTSGFFFEQLNTVLFGPIASNSSVSEQFSVDGQALPVLGPFGPPGGSASVKNVNLTGLTNPLLEDLQLTFDFGAGSKPGSTILVVTSSVPEPNEIAMIVLPLSALVFFGLRRRRREA